MRSLLSPRPEVPKAGWIVSTLLPRYGVETVFVDGLNLASAAVQGISSRPMYERHRASVLAGGTGFEPATTATR